jgi:hypothetical protein
LTLFVLGLGPEPALTKKKIKSNEILLQDIVYANSAPGFVRPDSESSSRVVDVETPSHSEIGQSGFDRYFSDVESVVNKLDDDDALLTKEELITLQVKTSTFGIVSFLNELEK